MLRVLVLRPQPGAAATLAAAAEFGLDALAFPLFEVRPLAWDPVPRGEIDALLLGSANALRHAGPALAAYRGLPAYCVGATTAEAARASGLSVAATGVGGLQNLLAELSPEHRRLLRLAGRERTVLDAPADVAITTRVVYASEPLPAPPGLRDALGGPAVVLLHSGEAAAHLGRLCAATGIDRSRIRLAAIGPRVAARAGGDWAEVRSAAHPDDAALLALAREMCQEAGSGQ